MSLNVLKFVKDFYIWKCEENVTEVQTMSDPSLAWKKAAFSQ